jgi:hypothetical protein
MAAGAGALRGSRGLIRPKCQESALEHGDLVAGSCQLFSRAVSRSRDGDLPIDQEELGAVHAVSLIEHLGREGLGPRLQITEPGGLSCNPASGCSDTTDNELVLVSDPLRERDTLEQILKASRLQYHADNVRASGFVCAHHLLGEH